MDEPPRWDLLINGRTLLAPSYKALVSSVRVEAVADGADELMIEATAWDSVSGEYRILGEQVLAAGNSVVVRAGYGVALRDLQRFQIVRHEAEYPDNGPPTVRVIGYSAEYRLAQATGPRSYPAPVTVGQVARELAAEHRLAVTATSVADGPTLSGPRIKEAGQSDLEFLRDLCAEADFGAPSVRWDGSQDVLFARPTRLDQQGLIARFVWRPAQADQAGTLITFSPSLSLAGAATRIEVIGWDALAGEPIRVVAELGDGGQQTTVFRGAEAGRLAERHRSGSELLVRVLADSDDPRTEVRDVAAVQSVRTTEDALAWGKRWLATRNRAWMVARATTVGWEDLWAGQVHEFAGLAPEHEGKWEVVRCSHLLDEQGYRCDLDLDYVLDEAASTREV